MAYMNDDLPYDEYIKYEENTRKTRPGPTRKSLTEMTSFLMSPLMKERINHILDKGLFPDKAEFFRYLIIKFLEDNKEWIR